MFFNYQLNVSSNVQQFREIYNKNVQSDGHMLSLAVKLAQLVRHSLMVREVASLIPRGAVFAHTNIELT